MNFTPNDMTVKNLFRTFPQFNIPVFQRDYSWDKQYYSKFIDDILKGISFNDEELKLSKYFIGTMVFSGESGDPIVDVVDGQQRLTVITILLSVISEQLIRIGEDGLGNATFKYVKELNDHDKYVQHLVSETSYPYLDSFIQSLDKTNAPSVQTDEEENLKETYDYFTSRLSENKLKVESVFLDTGVAYKNMLLAIRDQILASTVISISTPERDSAFMIFEILNAKGKSLASIDLVKNILFEEFHNDPNGMEANADTIWKNIKLNLRSREQNIGLATFYRHFWISKYKKVTNAKLYDSFKEEIVADKQNYFDFIKELEEESKRYIKIISPNLREDYGNRQEYKWLEQSLQSLNTTFGLVQTRLVLLALLDIKNKDLISTSKFKEAIQYIENFVFMYTGIGKNPANIYELRFSNLAISLRKTTSKSDTNDILKKDLYDAFSEYELDYTEFEQNFITLTYRKGKFNSNVLTKYIINKIGAYYQDDEIFIPNNSIEHIISENTKDDQTLSIGNLILLETNLNNAASDLSYEEKKEIYLTSRNNQVRNFVDKYDDFTLSDIEPRAKRLSKWYYENVLDKEIPK